MINWNWGCNPKNPNLGKNRQSLSRLTLKFHRWPWKTIWHIDYAALSFLHHFVAVCQLKRVMVWNAQISSKADRATPVCYFKLCASFCSHVWIQTRVTVWKRQIGVKTSDFFLFRVALKFGRWPRQNNRVVFYTRSNLVIITLSHGHLYIQAEVMTRKSPIWGKICFGPCDHNVWPLTFSFFMDITSVKW